MPAKAATELSAIALLERLLGSQLARAVETGIGDDAAVIRLGKRRVVWTIDASVEGVHFDRRWLSLEDVGWRSFQAAASDLAAMGARPIAALAGLVLPKGSTEKEITALGRGQADAARSLACPLIGGNISRGGELGVTTTLLGEVVRPILRSGARAGHELWLVGDVGLAHAGLELLRRGAAQRLSAAERVCVEAWRRPRALIAEGVRLRGRARAALDVSDGLSGDAARLASASSVRLILEERPLRSVLGPALQKAAKKLGEDPLELALLGGEDYALLAAGPKNSRPRGARRVGRIERGRGVFLEPAAGGRSVPLGPGFDHLV
jgi:thiamine-monophosphate kinase